MNNLNQCFFLTVVHIWILLFKTALLNMYKSKFEILSLIDIAILMEIFEKIVNKISIENLVIISYSTSQNKVIHFQNKTTTKQQQNNNKNKTPNLNQTQQNKTVVILL